MYVMKCPYCGLIFEVDKTDVGLPPFVVECPDCGEEVDDAFIIYEYED